MRKKICLVECPIAGSKHRPLFSGMLRIGDELELEREPKNEFDRFAVKVSAQGNQVGYVPRQWSQAISGLLEAGVLLVATVSESVQTHHAMKISVCPPPNGY